MADHKTKFTGASVEDYIAPRASETQRADCRDLLLLLESITRAPPRMWGPSIVGFGSYRYAYESGHSGEAPVTGFAIRGRDIVVYVDVEGDEQQSLLAKLGKHKMGKMLPVLPTARRPRHACAQEDRRQLDRRSEAALRVARAGG